MTRAERRAQAMLVGMNYSAQGDYFYETRYWGTMRYDPDTMEPLTIEQARARSKRDDKD